MALRSPHWGRARDKLFPGIGRMAPQEQEEEEKDQGRKEEQEEEEEEEKQEQEEQEEEEEEVWPRVGRRREGLRRLWHLTLQEGCGGC